jgi:FMN-binding protein
MHRLILLLTGPILLAGFFVTTAQAESVYQQPDDFISEVFVNQQAEVKRLWISKELQEKIRIILGHDIGLLRLRYWQYEQRTAWILEEIGKTEAITFGFVINRNAIELTRVLIFRESRGWEIRYPFFTDQYKNAELDSDLQLNQSIDGISGATLSVAAFTKLARLALLLHQYSNATAENLDQ